VHHRPASRSPKIDRPPFERGNGCGALNFSHGTHGACQEHFDAASGRHRARKTDRIWPIFRGRKSGRSLAGGGPVLLRSGQRFVITTAKVLGDSSA